MRRISVLLMVILGCWSTVVSASPAWSARQIAQSTFPPGAVISLQGTVHLWIADQTGTLHWGGDTRALQGQTIDWNTRISVSLDTLKTLRIGDPLLSAGLMKDGTPIYLVKWETTDVVPRLLHIQSICDVEVFGINTDNYGKFVLDRAPWEARYNLRASALERGELPTTTCTPSPNTPTPTSRHPVIPLAAGALTSLDRTLSSNSLTQASINADRPTTLALGDNAPVVQAAPLVSTPKQNMADLSRSDTNLPIGVLVVNRGVSGGGADLPPGAYLVKVRSGRVRFVGTDTNERGNGLPLDARRLRTTQPAPRTTLTYRDVCFSWAQVQVCTQPQPISALMGSERSDQQSAITSARDALNGRGYIKGDVNVAATVSEAEGLTAVGQQRANVVAAPAVDFPNATHTGPAPAGTFAGIIVVNTPIDMPGHPLITAGQYAVQSTGDPARTTLLPADGGLPIDVPSNSIEVRGAPGGSIGLVPPTRSTGAVVGAPMVAAAVAGATQQVDESLAVIANLCFSGEGDFPLCLLFEPVD
jgi:hypothetical protein